MRNPLLSIITITFNSERFLEQAISSVVSQTYENVEYIVVDGGSKDGTLEVIKRYTTSISKWLSEPDQGIADAMNKGLQYATGDYVLFLHSDDYLSNENVLAEAVLQMTDPVDIYLFDIFLSGKGTVKRCRSRGWTWLMYFKTGVFHQSALCSRRLFQEIGGFDASLKIAMDYDFFFRAYRQGARVKRIALPLSVMRLCGVSSRSDWPSLRCRFREERAVHVKLCASSWLRMIYSLYWPLYLSYRKIRHCVPRMARGA